MTNTVYAQAQERIGCDPDVRLKSGGKPKYLLSGQLRCGVCGAHYILSNAHGYSCSGYLGGDCTNGTRVRRDRVEEAILAPLRDELLAPDRMARMAKELQQSHAASVKGAAARADSAPAELLALDTRIARLRERLADGDPDIEPDEIQVAIDRAEAKRRELETTLQPSEALGQDRFGAAEGRGTLSAQDRERHRQ